MPGRQGRVDRAMMIGVSTPATTHSPLRALFVHTVVYVAVNGLLVSLWVVLVGSAAELGDVIADPSTALDVGFWPIFLILGWGTALLIHAGVAIAQVSSPAARRARREQKRRERRRRDIERQVERGRAKGEELLAKTAHAAIESAVTAVGSLRPRHGDDDARPALPRSGTRWVAVMFTDLSDSTGLAESMGDEEWSRVLARHRSIVRDCLREHGGDEIGTQGDGFLVRHESPEAAVAAAVAIQRSHQRHRHGRQFMPEVRIGVHAGDAVHDDGDLIGQVVNLAARVMSVAEPGQILITEPVADRLDPTLTLTDCGLHDLRGVSRPRHLLAVDW